MSVSDAFFVLVMIALAFALLMMAVPKGKD